MRTLQPFGNFISRPVFVDFLTDDFDKLLNGVMDDSELIPVPQGLTFQPNYEISENDQGYMLSFDVPGVPKDDIHVEVHDGQLRVWGERHKHVEKSAAKGRSYSENRYGRFERTFTLPADTDSEKIQAHHEHGVLHLSLPKSEKVQAKNIKIESGSPSFFSRIVGKDGEKEKSENIKIQ